MFISLIGTWIQITAQSWLVLQLTNSAFLLGVVGFLSSIPIFAFSMLGGAAADRISKKHMLIATQTIFMFLAFLLGGLTQMKVVTPAQIMIIATLNGITMAFDAPSRQAMVVDLVGKNHLMNAIALNSASFNASRIIGPALAGILVAIVGLSGCFYLNGISFLAVIFALLLIRINTAAKSGRNKNSMFADIREGFVFIRNNRFILVLISIVAIASLFGVSYIILMPLVADGVLHVGIRGLGMLMSASGIGALIGALVLARLGDFRQKGRFLVVSVFIFSSSLFIFSFSRSFLLSLFLLVFIGGSSIAVMALVNTILQTKVEDKFRGRVMGLFMLTFAGIMPFGNLISGALSQLWGVSFALMLNGLICTVSFAVINILLPDIRRL